MDKRFWAAIGVIAVVFIGIIFINSRHASAPASNAAPTNHIFGDGAKGVTLVEYGDFQCPVCGLYEPTVKQVREKYKADIHFQFRNYPLQQVHQNAFAGARAAEAASLQGKFWEMHDQLFAGQQAWSTASDPLSIFKGYAQTIGINAGQFQTDFNSKKVNDTINADIHEGDKLKVTGTPTFYLDGKQIQLGDLVDSSTNSPSVDKFSKVIDNAIKAKETASTSKP
jgi:protein-disulfide isomerase